MSNLLTKSALVFSFLCLAFRLHVCAQDSTHLLKTYWGSLKNEIEAYNQVVLKFTENLSKSKSVTNALVTRTKNQLFEARRFFNSADTPSIELIKVIKPKYDSIFNSLSICQNIITKKPQLSRQKDLANLRLQLESSLNRLNVSRYEFNTLCWKMGRKELIWDFYMPAVKVEF